MTDKELLELAAKAAGIELKWGYLDDSALQNDPTKDVCWSSKGGLWDPLPDDGDALRLAVKLNLLILPYPGDLAIRVTRLDQPETIVSWGTPPDPYAAARRAIVRAAATIGEKM
jgi:hypothetical protein